MKHDAVYMSMLIYLCSTFSEYIYLDKTSNGVLLSTQEVLTKHPEASKPLHASCLTRQLSCYGCK